MKIEYIYCTFPNIRLAKKVGRVVLLEKLAACINIIPDVRSLYRWKGKIESDKECVVIIKTTKSKTKNLIRFIENNHPYETPSISSLSVCNISKEFERWIKNECK
ncbi:MAG: cation tolerance protein CutA [Gammaproteobacteria bacterium]|mgnify:CR=1 FL=1|nr:cation tolerance protein CutA [Gammaproteobacteria bacterium]|tara:strand:- start:5615 stop:5929 length:315 start_codon:yes stop_codon:yes gene_type:complete